MLCMSQHIDFNSPSTQRLVAIIVFAFLLTFVLARLVVYLVLGKIVPNFFLVVDGVHIHHFTYGVVILVLVGLYLIIVQPSPSSKKFRRLTFLYGIGLGLTFDEFGMWIRLQDNYWARQSYDAIVIVLLILLNVAYARIIGHILRSGWNRIIGKSMVKDNEIL